MEDIELWFKIGAGVAAMIAGGYFGFKEVLRFIKGKKAKKSEKAFTEVNMRIWEVLTELRIRSNACRATLAQFHNGGKYVDGSSMRRMSITHQSCDQKASSTMQFRQDSLVSRFVELIELLQENDSDIRMVTEDDESNSKRFLEVHDTLAYSILPVQCKHSLAIHGYIMIEWCDLGRLDNLDESKFQDEIDDARDQIAFLLSTAEDYR
jgi:hypothetical protein